MTLFSLSKSGTAGFILCIFPEHEQAFHGCLLFTAGFALQYDDLSDLYLIRTSGLPNPTFKSKIVPNDTSMDDMQDNKRNLFSSICSLLLHVLSILLMSVLAMILGVQVASKYLCCVIIIYSNISLPENMRVIISYLFSSHHVISAFKHYQYSIIFPGADFAALSTHYFPLLCTYIIG